MSKINMLNAHVFWPSNCAEGAPLRTMSFPLLNTGTTHFRPNGRVLGCDQSSAILPRIIALLIDVYLPKSRSKRTTHQNR